MNAGQIGVGDPEVPPHHHRKSRALRRSAVVCPAGSGGGLRAFGGFQSTAQIPGSLQGGFDARIVDVIFKEDNDFASWTLPGVTGLHASCPVPEITSASFAVD
jgi:hypothetical protein